MAVAILILVWSGNDIIRSLESDEPSESHGTAASGSLENGKRLPTRGANFVSYSRLGALVGRATVHHAVRDTVLGAFAELQQDGWTHRFVLGETGWHGGGEFAPHRTHQNGTSVDFMVPLLDEQGRSRRFPTRFATRFGYDLEFDDQGASSVGRIDFSAVAAHLDALATAGAEHGVEIERVIIAPEYITRVRAAVGPDMSLGRVRFMEGEAWVRHDEHYHVDFAL
jgi:penicillin-insensitive murein DD-endopeptidase